MEMLIRTVFFFLLYLKCRIIYRNQVYFRGFSVVCAMKGSNILFNNAGGGVKSTFSPIHSAICLDCRNDALLWQKTVERSLSTKGLE